MTHFTDEKWLDFARQVIPPEEISSMQAHLDSGCKKCTQLYNMWKAVNTFARGESNFAPNNSLVDAVKLAYSDRVWKPVPRPKIRFAALLFDSLAAEGAAVGIRSISSAARHLLYRTEPLTIDVRLDDYCGASIMIAGQVLQTAGGTTSADCDEVFLMCGDEILARTSTNEFGEFQLESDRRSNLRIRVDFIGQPPVVLTLPD